MRATCQIFILNVIVLSCLTPDIAALARIDNWSQRRPNATAAVPAQNHWPHNAATTRNPYQAWNAPNSSAVNQWGRQNQTAHNLPQQYPSNNNNLHNPQQTRHNYTQQYPSNNNHYNPQQPQPQPQTGWNNVGRLNQTYSYPQNPQQNAGWNTPSRPNATNYATTPTYRNDWSPNGNNHNPQQYSSGFNAQNHTAGNWGQVSNGSHYQPTTPPHLNNNNNNNNIGWGGGSAGAGQNNWNNPQPSAAPSQNPTAASQAHQQNPAFGTGWDQAPLKGPTAPGATPLTPIGQGNPWIGGNAAQGAAGTIPLAPLAGGVQPWNNAAGQANLSYGNNHQPQPPVASSNPYAHLFN